MSRLWCAGGQSSSNLAAPATMQTYSHFLLPVHTPHHVVATTIAVQKCPHVSRSENRYGSKGHPDTLSFCICTMRAQVPIYNIQDRSGALEVQARRGQQGKLAVAANPERRGVVSEWRSPSSDLAALLLKL